MSKYSPERSGQLRSGIFKPLNRCILVLPIHTSKTTNEFLVIGQDGHTVGGEELLQSLGTVLFGDLHADWKDGVTKGFPRIRVHGDDRIPLSDWVSTAWRTGLSWEQVSPSLRLNPTLDTSGVIFKVRVSAGEFYVDQSGNYTSIYDERFAVNGVYDPSFFMDFFHCETEMDVIQKLRVHVARSTSSPLNQARRSSITSAQVQQGIVRSGPGIREFIQANLEPIAQGHVDVIDGRVITKGAPRQAKFVISLRRLDPIVVVANFCNLYQHENLKVKCFTQVGSIVDGIAIFDVSTTGTLALLSTRFRMLCICDELHSRGVCEYCYFQF